MRGFGLTDGALQKLASMQKEAQGYQEDDDLGLSMVANALQDLDHAFARVEEAMMAAPSAYEDRGVIMQMHKEVTHMISSYVQ